MSLSMAMVLFYYQQLDVLCTTATVLHGLPENLEQYYDACYEEAITIYRKIKATAKTQAVQSTSPRE